jgi:hypothetical protein
VLNQLTDEIDQRGGELVVVLVGYEKAVFETVLAFNHGALASRFRRTYALADFTDEELTSLLRSQLSSTYPNYRVGDDKYAHHHAWRAARRHKGTATHTTRCGLSRLPRRQTATATTPRPEDVA